MKEILVFNATAKLFKTIWSGPTKKYEGSTAEEEENANDFDALATVFFFFLS